MDGQYIDSANTDNKALQHMLSAKTDNIALTHILSATNPTMPQPQLQSAQQTNKRMPPPPQPPLPPRSREPLVQPSEQTLPITYNILLLNAYIQHGKDILENTQQNEEIKNNYYMILDTALSVVLDIQFMNRFFDIQQHNYFDDLLSLNPDPKTNIFNDTREEVIDFVKTLSYDEKKSIGPLYKNSELLLIHDTICKYYGDNKSRHEEFIKKYEQNYTKCIDTIIDFDAKSIWDAKNFSLNIFLIFLSSIAQEGDLFDEYHYIGICNSDNIPVGHIFYVKHYIQQVDLEKKQQKPYNIEAIGIQQSFVTLLSSIKYKIKYRISQILFDEIIKYSLYKHATYMYAYAWSEISRILVEHYGFTSIRMQFCLNTKHNCVMRDVKNMREELPQDIDIPGYLHMGNYIYTYKRITDEEKTRRD